MMPHRGLSRQILLSLTAVMVGFTIVVLISLYVFYAVLFLFNPALAACPPDSWIPIWHEWIFMGLLVLAALVTATITAAKLAARILTPLNSVAESIRLVARGELHARAAAGDRSFGETAALVDDFNAMAERLQRTAHELMTWNAAIAHELRTPVTILRGRLQGLAEGVFPPSEAQFRSLLGQVEGLARLIDDLRTLSLADGGHLNLRLSRVNIADEIRELAELMAPALADARLQIEIKAQAQYVVCDLLRIRQVVLALLDNARRYAQPGRILIETALYDGWFHIMVEDDGPGLSAELAARVFDSFQRGTDSRSRDSGGTGLGLAVVRAIAHAHGGRAVYRSGDNGGAIFEVAFRAQETLRI